MHVRRGRADELDGSLSPFKTPRPHILPQEKRKCVLIPVLPQHGRMGEGSDDAAAKRKARLAARSELMKKKKAEAAAKAAEEEEEKNVVGENPEVDNGEVEESALKGVPTGGQYKASDEWGWVRGRVRTHASMEERVLLVVGEIGATIREGIAIDSQEVGVAKAGCLLRVLEAPLSYGNSEVSRQRLFVEVKEGEGRELAGTKGWVSMKSNEGYVILREKMNLVGALSRFLSRKSRHNTAKEQEKHIKDGGEGGFARGLTTPHARTAKTLHEQFPLCASLSLSSRC